MRRISSRLQTKEKINEWASRVQLSAVVENWKLVITAVAAAVSFTDPILALIS